jgi:hypothetical protein
MRKLIDCSVRRSHRNGRYDALGVVYQRRCGQNAAGKKGNSRKGAAPFLACTPPTPAEFSRPGSLPLTSMLSDGTSPPCLEREARHRL